MNDKPFCVAFIADIHFRALPSESLFMQLKERFLKVVKKYPVDMIVFGGDLFHNIITMNYSTSHVVLMFMESIIELAKSKNIKYIRIIQGTISHDNNQLHNFHMFEDKPEVDFRIIMNVQEEELAEGIKILYVPEEYMTSPKEYYAKYLDGVNKKYDFIFGHGMVREVAFVAKSQESENTMSKAPIFESKQLINACRGPVFFGHIHIRTTIRDHLYYPGSFSRWRFGEEDPKGWYLCLYEPNTGKYLNKFIENDLASEYITVSVELTETFAKHPELIESTLKHIVADHIRLRLEVGDVDSSFAIKYLTDTYGKGSSVKIDIKNKEKEMAEEHENEIMEQLKDKYGFVFDESLTLAEVIQKFIKAKKDKDTPIEVIEDELTGLK
jgi:DNA repair exonuclease SbcCD nuclease subunit